MTIYILLVGYLAGLAFVQGFMCDTVARRRVFAALAFAPMVLVMGLRGPSVGVDTIPYERFYILVGESNNYMNIVNSAPVYSVFSKVLYMVNSDPQFLLFCCSLVICGGVAYFSYRLSCDVVMSAFLYVAFYYFCNAMNMMRQALALSLCLVALTMVLEKRKIGLPIAISLMAFGVHNTCIVLIPFVFMPLIRLDRIRVHRLTYIIVTGVVLFAVSLPILVSIFAAIFPGWYGQYVGKIFDSTYAATGRNLIRTLFYVGLLLLYYRERVYLRCNSADCWMYLMVLGGLALSTIFFQNYLLGERIPMYYLVLLVVMVPNALCCLGGSAKLAAKTIIVVLSTAMLIVLLNGNYSGVVPYSGLL